MTDRQPSAGQYDVADELTGLPVPIEPSLDGQLVGGDGFARPPKRTLYGAIAERWRTPDELEGAKNDFLQALERVEYRGRAAKEAQVSYSSFLDWMQADPDFAQAVEFIEQVHTDTIRAEIKRRAVEGVEKPVYWQNMRIDDPENPNRVYSDILLIVEAKRRDEQYRDRAKIEVNNMVKLYETVDDSRI